MKRMNRSFPYAQTLLISTGVSVGGSMLMLCLISLFFSAADIPSGAIPTLSLLAVAAGTFCGGFLAARRTGERGLLNGVLTGAATLLLFLAVGLFAAPVTAAIFSKSAAILVGAALGGVFGVNKRKRIRH